MAYIYFVNLLNIYVMKKTTILIIVFFTFTFFSCDIESLESVEKIESTKSLEKKQEADFIVTESNVSNLEDSEEHCKTVNLIAGQNNVAGTVTVDVEGNNLIITYTTNDDWTIDATHLSVTNCEEGGFPSTNSGNPKIGKFEYSSTHEDGITQVTYTIPLDDIEIFNQFCFAAHAEVSGPTQETAWAEGSDFGGNSWAMFVEATLSECNDNNGGGGIG